MKHQEVEWEEFKEQRKKLIKLAEDKGFSFEEYFIKRYPNFNGYEFNKALDYIITDSDPRFIADLGEYLLDKKVDPKKIKGNLSYNDAMQGRLSLSEYGVNRFNKVKNRLLKLVEDN